MWVRILLVAPNREVGRFDSSGEDHIQKESYMEFILSSAIKYKLADSPYWQVACGKRHVDIYEKFFESRFAIREIVHEGFWTNKSRFVNRNEAFQIALAANQILPDILEDYQERFANFDHLQLYSEDMWPD